MKLKIYFFRISILILLLSSTVNVLNAQSFKNLKSFDQYLIYKDSSWNLMSIKETDTSLFKIDTSTITIRMNKEDSTLDSMYDDCTSQFLLIDSFSNYYKYSINYTGNSFSSVIDSLTKYISWQDIILSDMGSLNSTDPYFNNQTYLGINHLNIETNRAFWGYGNPNITVAIIDGFFDVNHTDLGATATSNGNIWVNSGEDAWTPQNPRGNGIDDDNNGLVDDWKGYDFFYNDNDVSPTIIGAPASTIPYNYHGTIIAGIVGARNNNNIGIAGIAGGNNSDGVKLMCLNVAKYNTTLTYNEPTIDKFAVARAILYACQNGAKIISMTVAFAPNTYAPMIDEAISTAIRKYDCLVVCASGNGSSNTSISDVHYPANIEEVIAVGAYDNNFNNIYTRGKKLDFTALSMEGANQSSAPYLLTPNSAYGIHGGGTSIATGQIVGILALILSKYECLPPTDLLKILAENSDFPKTCSVVNGKCVEYGYGQPNLIEIQYALEYLEFNNPVINSAITINDVKVCQTDIIINQGASLTINGTLIMANGKKIIVQPKGKLFLQNGGKITSNCEWGGVEIYGDQDPSSNQSESVDGKLTIRTGGTIENAKIGVKTIDEGIVDVNNGRFINNYISILMQPQYSLTNVASQEMYNQCIVLNSAFKIDKELKSTSYNNGTIRKSYESFIKMENVRAVKIMDNIFTVNENKSEGIAIWGFGVDLYLRKNIFNNVYSAVEAGGFPTFKYSSSDINFIYNNTLNNVSRGFTLFNLRKPILSTNNIQLAKTNIEYTNDGFFEYNWGINSFNCGVEIIDNTISSLDGRAYGTIINNNTISKLIRPEKLSKNIFDHLYIGSQFEYLQTKIQPYCNIYQNISKHAWSISPNRADKQHKFPNIGNEQKNIVGGNIFNDLDNNTLKHIRSSNYFTYVAAEEPEAAIPVDVSSTVNIIVDNIKNNDFCSNINLIQNTSVICENCGVEDLLNLYFFEQDTIQRLLIESELINLYEESHSQNDLYNFIVENNLTQKYSKELFLNSLLNGDIIAAEDYLSMFPATNQEELDFITLYVLIMDMEIENLSISDLSINQKNSLLTIKGRKNKASEFAANMLKYGYGYKFNQNPSEWQEEAEQPMLGLKFQENSVDYIKVYPNPSKEYAQIHITSKVGDELRNIEVYSSIGKLVLCHTSLNVPKFNIENSTLDKGIYTIKIKTKHHAQTFKYIK